MYSTSNYLRQALFELIQAVSCCSGPLLVPVMDAYIRMPLNGMSAYLFIQSKLQFATK